GLHRLRRRAHPLRPDLVPLARAVAGRGRPGAGARRQRGLLARLGPALRPLRRLPRRDPPVAARAEGADVRAHGRHRRGTDHVAAERIGGVRNWDYRFCWLRDATLTLLAMLNAGYREEAVMWRQWLLRAVAGDPADIQIMYGVAGERRLDEREIEWLPGYEESRPVRVGNAASEQLQLDVYGEVLDALYQTRAHGAPPDEYAWGLTLELLEWLEDGWRQEDAGIWEM